MKTFSLVICFIGAAALLAGFATPSDADSATKAPAVQVDEAPVQWCAMPEDVDDAVPKANCLLCGSASTGACKGARQCKGTRKACRAKGCKITGTGSCSTAANVKTC